MINYQRTNVLAPQDIEKRNAYLIGGGIVSLAAAVWIAQAIME